MAKKILILTAMLSLLVASVQAEPIIYAGAQAVIKDGMGAGTMLSFGYKVSDKVVFLAGTHTSLKTHDATEIDNAYAGATIFTDYLIPDYNIGGFIGIQAGGTKVEGEKTTFGSLGFSGIYIDIKPSGVKPGESPTKLMIGGTYADAEKTGGIYSFQIGLLMTKPW